MRIILTIIAVCLTSSFTFSQAKWHKLNSIPEAGVRYDDVFFLTADLGWVCDGYGGTVYKTTDGGDTWELQFKTSAYFRNIEFLNSNIGFLGTLQNDFFKTLNGGKTWKRVDSIEPYPEAICGLDAVGSSIIYGCGAYFSPAWVIKSVDSGNTWQYIDMTGYASALVEVLFINEKTGYVSGSGPDNYGLSSRPQMVGSHGLKFFNQIFRETLYGKCR